MTLEEFSKMQGFKDPQAAKKADDKFLGKLFDEEEEPAVELKAA